MAVLPGVQLRLFLNKPVLAGSLPAGPIVAGQRITGRLAAAPATDVPAATQVRITLPGSEPFDVDVDAQGNWTFTAPAPAGEFTAADDQRLQPLRAEHLPHSGQNRRHLNRRHRAVPVPVRPAQAGHRQRPRRRRLRVAEPAVLAPVPQPTVVAVLPAAVPDPDSRPMMLADTGVSGLTLAAAVAARFCCSAAWCW